MKLKELLTEPYFNEEDLMKELVEVKLDDLINTRNLLLTDYISQGFILGNIDEAKSVELFKKIEESLRGPSPSTKK